MAVFCRIELSFFTMVCSMKRGLKFVCEYSTLLAACLEEMMQKDRFLNEGG